MARFSVARQVPENQRVAVLESIHAILIAEHTLSPRSKNSLRRSYDRGDLCFASSDSGVVGWVLCLPRGAQAQELAGGYIVPGCRGSGAISAILRTTLARKRFTVCVTSNATLAVYLRRFWGFERCGLRRLIRLTGLSMLRDRLSPARMRYGSSYIRVEAMRMLVFDRTTSVRLANELG